MIACIHDDRLHSYLGHHFEYIHRILNDDRLHSYLGHHFEYREYDDRLHSYLGIIILNTF
jgi:hypothetical protein